MENTQEPKNNVVNLPEIKNEMLNSRKAYFRDLVVEHASPINGQRPLCCQIKTDSS